MRTAVKFLLDIVIIIAIYYAACQTVLINFRIASGSMEPTLYTGDRLIGNRLEYRFGHNPGRFDIIIFHHPDDKELLYTKRIIGLPGETVAIRNGQVYINDSSTPLDNSFILEPMEREVDTVFEVPEDCYVVLGDNRNDSDDSRYWENSFVRREDVIARAGFRYWSKKDNKKFRIL